MKRCSGAAITLGALAFGVIAAACGGGDNDKKLTTYSGWMRELVEPQPGQRVGVTGTGRIHAHPNP